MLDLLTLSFISLSLLFYITDLFIALAAFWITSSDLASYSQIVSLALIHRYKVLNCYNNFYF